MSDHLSGRPIFMKTLTLTALQSGGEALRFTGSFTIGRDESCGLTVASPHVSRVHAAISFEEGGWWAVDLGSTNGILLDGERVSRGQLRPGSRLQIGKGGPEYRVDLEGPASADAARPGRDTKETNPSGSPTPGSAATVSAHAPGDVASAVDKYFTGDDAHAGPQTRVIRRAYQEALQRDRRPLWVALGALAVVLVLTGTWLTVQSVRLRGLEARAEALFLAMRETDLLLTNFRRALEQNTGSGFEEQLVALERQRDRQREEYEGYVEQLGFYRRMRSEEERAIYRMARTFGESEFSMQRDFVQAVEREIREYWLGNGRERLLEAIERGDRTGSTGRIVETLRTHGLPPEFFYLALQESDLEADAVGPLTRFGRAKGMWQFIPVTAARYGLDPGPRPDAPDTDIRDMRLDPRQATDAAARYLRDLYAELAQASGLLVMAAYNWGEHRVNPRLRELETPDEVFRATFADVDQTPEARNYWRFLGSYGDRMPEETKDYVLKIFSAAVLGSNPALFGLDMADPLAPYRARE